MADANPAFCPRESGLVQNHQGIRLFRRRFLHFENGLFIQADPDTIRLAVKSEDVDPKAV